MGCFGRIIKRIEKQNLKIPIKFFLEGDHRQIQTYKKSKNNNKLDTKNRESNKNKSQNENKCDKTFLKTTKMWKVFNKEKTQTYLQRNSKKTKK